MVETVETYDEWYSLHDFRQLIGKNGKQLLQQLKKALQEFHTLLDRWQRTEDNKQENHLLFKVPIKLIEMSPHQNGLIHRSSEHLLRYVLYLSLNNMYFAS